MFKFLEDHFGWIAIGVIVVMTVTLTIEAYYPVSGWFPF